MMEKPLASIDLVANSARPLIGRVAGGRRKGDTASMEEKIDRELLNLRNEIKASGHGETLSWATLVGTAGTPVTLAAIDRELSDFDYSKVHGHVLALESIRSIGRKLIPLTPEQRLAFPGSEKGREDLVAAGILVTLRTMELFGFHNMVVCDTGLLEGLLLDGGGLNFAARMHSGGVV